MFRNFRKRRLYDRIVRVGERSRAVERAMATAESDHELDWLGREYDYLSHKLEQLRERYFAL